MSTICQWAGFAHPRWAFVAPHLSGASAQVEWLADTVGIDAALARRAAELEGKPVTKQAVNVDGDRIERIGEIIDEIAKS